MESHLEGLSVGRSLWPVAAGGSRLRAVGQSPKVGEVVVYRLGQGLRAHRVLAVSQGSLLVRGDNPMVPLERVSADQVVGVWQPEGLRSRLTLGAVTGRAIGTLALAASRVARVRGARAMANLVPRAAPGGLHVVVATEDPSQLAVSLGEVGLLRPLRTTVEVQFALLTGRGFAVLARAEQGTVAALRALPQADALLLGITVKRRYRGQGLGRRLLDAALAEARRREAGSLVADIRRDNTASLRLFQGAGFTRVAEAVLVAPGDGVLLDRYALDLG